jgi:hypothetical protein
MRSIEREQAHVASIFDEQVLRVFGRRPLLRFLRIAQDTGPPLASLDGRLCSTHAGCESGYKPTRSPIAVAARLEAPSQKDGVLF